MRHLGADMGRAIQVQPTDIIFWEFNWSMTMILENEYVWFLKAWDIDYSVYTNINYLILVRELGVELKKKNLFFL